MLTITNVAVQVYNYALLGTAGFVNVAKMSYLAFFLVLFPPLHCHLSLPSLSYFFYPAVSSRNGSERSLVAKHAALSVKLYSIHTTAL